MTQLELKAYKLIEQLNLEQRYKLAVKILKEMGSVDEEALPKPEEVKKKPSKSAKGGFGVLAGTGKILGDIISPIDVEWNAMTQTDVNPPE